MTSHPLGRAARADAVAKFEGLRKGTGRLQNLGKGSYIKGRSAPGWRVSFCIMFWIKGTHSACKATVLGD